MVGFGEQKLVIDWTMIDGAAAARRFGGQIVEAPRSFADRTSISGGIRLRGHPVHSSALRSRAPHHRRIGGRHQQLWPRGAARPRQGNRQRDRHQRHRHPSDPPMSWMAEHTNPPGGLEKYYRDNVIAGPGSFVMVAQDFRSFGRAIVKKMIAEIAGPPPRQRMALGLR